MTIIIKQKNKYKIISPNETGNNSSVSSTEGCAAFVATDITLSSIFSFDLVSNSDSVSVSDSDSDAGRGCFSG